MKKTYIAPATLCVAVNCDQLLTSGSMNFDSEEKTGTVYDADATDESLSRSINVWDFDEE